MTREEAWLLEEKYGGAASAPYAADLARLASGEPVAYVIGSQPFLGLDIYLNSHPLIPRPETEYWTEKMLAHVRTSDVPGTSDVRIQPLRFLDLCAGSGAIGCAALKALSYIDVFFGEIDPAHEATIVRNIRDNGLDESRAHVGIGDLFEPFGDMTFDVIATNPPYVPADRVLPASVADYEPGLALWAGSDGLDYIRRIAAELPRRLAPGGVAYIECDRGHAEACRDLFIEQGLTAEIRTDQYDKPRFIVVSFA